MTARITATIFGDTPRAARWREVLSPEALARACIFVEIASSPHDITIAEDVVVELPSSPPDIIITAPGGDA